jgi:lipoprotein-anchoring transpeptidase ErfK/SrfK
MKRRRRHARTFGSRILGSARITVSVLLALLLLAGGSAYAAYRYDAATVDRLLPGTRIGGVDVGEMTRAQAIDAVRENAELELDRQIEITAGGESWHVTPAELGTKARVKAAVDTALATSGEFSWPSRVWSRILNSEVGRSFEVEFRYNDDRVGEFVETVSAAVNVSPTDAAVDFVDGELVLRKPEEGRELRVRKATASLTEALAEPAGKVRFGVRELKPEVGVKDLGYTIVVRLSTLKLYLYQGNDLVKTYPVAAGQPAYPTPLGEWNVINKAENPTWINPAPDGWGASMPATIPGGPGNPLGTRALYLDAPGIRIHGTSDTGSIGTFASHGCVRMTQADVEALYEIVPIGTKVHVVH